MPPKAPNLKFKPKLVRSQRSDEQVNEDGHDEDLALRQLERLRRAQQELETATPTVKREEAADAPTAPGFPAPGPTTQGVHRDAAPRQLPHDIPLTQLFGGGRDLPSVAPALPADTLRTAMTQADAEEHGVLRYMPAPLDRGGPSRPVRSSSKSIQDDATAGTAFLRAMDEELALERQRNMEFYRSVLAPMGAPVVKQEEDQDVAGGAHPRGGSVVWLQLPRLHASGGTEQVPFDIRHMPPGKIGEVKVYESGRMTMEINGCCFDVSADAVDEAGGGPCSLAVMMTRNGPSATPTCYFLDVLQHKLQDACGSGSGACGRIKQCDPSLSPSLSLPLSHEHTSLLSLGCCSAVHSSLPVRKLCYTYEAPPFSAPD
eukprot:gene6123-4404_t